MAVKAFIYTTSLKGKMKTFNHQPFFYIEKKGKKGFYPPQKDPIYDHLEQVSASFYRFERDGIKGYLDGISFNEITTNN